MAAGDGFELEVYDDELGRYVRVPDPSAKPLAVRKKKAAQAKEPSAGDYLNTLGDVLFVNPRNSAAATLGGAAYDYAVKSTPRSVVRDITESAEDAGDWLRKEGKLIRAAPITESLRLLKAGFIDPLADPYRVFKQAATERARGNTTGGKKLAAMVPLAVAGVLPQGRGASKVATKAGVEAATKTATKKATKAAAPSMTVTPKAKSKPPSLLSAVRVGGKTYTGPTHLDALDAIPDPKVRSQAALDANSRGFVNERGKYMDRFKAADYARNFDLFSPDAPDWAKTAPEVISENLRLPELAVKAETPKSRKAKYQPVEPVAKPHPELADVEFPSGSGKGGAFAVERKVPIVGRRPFIAQSPGGYSRLAGGLPANQVTVESKPFVEMPERQFLDPHDLVKEFRSIVPFIGDKLRGGEDIISIAGRPQEGYARAHSGPDFARQQMGAGGREVWASGPSVISALDRMALEGQEKFGGPVAGVYTTMGPEALDQTTAMMEQIGRQIAAGGVNPKDVRAFDEAIRTASRKDDEAIPDFVGFANDPMEAIRQLNDVKNVSMGQRRTLTQMMNAKPWLEAGLPDIGANRAGLTIPELLYAPEGTSGFSISALEPGKGALPDEAVSLAHPNYLKKLGGTYLGGFEVGVPRELAWSKLYGHPEMQKYEQFRQLGYLFGRPPKEIRADFGHDPRIQPIDEQWADQIAEYIDAVKKYGEEPYASGGLAVRKKKSFAAKAK